jgi:mannose-6-phosphate isomerase
MPVSMKLKQHHVEKPWGRESIPQAFGPTNGKRIGEIWFESPTGSDLPLLTKYIFTNERLSIQVHPSDQQARERGLPRGKSECWYILDAEPNARLGLGLTDELSADELRQVAIDGRIEQFMDWRKVAPGEFYFIPPGTIHAIGAGITLLEFQQNVDVTYRLFDYGRPRELHLDDGIAVSKTDPYPERLMRRADAPTDTILLDGPEFSVVRASRPDGIPASIDACRRWVMPIAGQVAVGDELTGPGECIVIEPAAAMEFANGTIALVGSEGAL